ncbi:MAG: hypothetical protein RR199_02655 [Alistipes sp.]
MNFDPARQTFIPAFLLLLVFTFAAVHTMEALQPLSAAATVSATVNAAERVPGLLLPLLDTLITNFQVAHPLVARLLAGFLMLLTGIYIGRMTARYNLYSVNTCLPIPLYAIIACCLSMNPNYLSGFVATTLLTFAIRNFARSFCNGYGFDGIYRGTFYLGLVVLVTPTALPLLLLLPLAIVLFRRTLREVAVALAGLLFAPCVLCYVNWGAGGSFIAPALQLWSCFVSNPSVGLFTAISLPTLILLGGILILDLLALFLFFTDHYTVGTKPRFILIFAIGALLLTISLFFVPSASPVSMALLTIPSALLLPLLFVRINRLISLSLYLFLIAITVTKLLLQ